MLDRRVVLTSALAAAVAGATRASAAGTPFKLFDTHAHFYTNAFDKYPLRPDVSAAAREKATTHPMTDEVILKLWDAAGVEMGCGVQYNTTYYTDDRYLLDAAAAHPKRIRPVVILDATDAATPAALARMAKENHICGVRFAGPPNAAGVHAFLSDAAAGAWEAANALGLVIVLMPTNGDAPAAMKRIGQLADRYPNVQIVIDHIGFPTPQVSPTFGLSPEHLALAAHRNVNYKYTTLLIEQLIGGKVPTRDFLEYAVSRYGADRMVWGSDIGNTVGDYGEFVRLARESAAGLPAQQQRALFYDTAKRLFIPGGRGPAKA